MKFNQPIFNQFLVTFSALFLIFSLQAQELEVDGSVKIVDGTQGSGKVLVSDAQGNASWQNLSGGGAGLPVNPAPGAMVYWDGTAWQTVAPGTTGDQLYFCNGVPQWGTCSGGPTGQPLLTQTYSIQQSWSQETNYDRDYHVIVPSGAGPFPVVIALHGNGGNGAGFINSIGYLGANAIRIAPDGYLNSWNVDFENSKAPDVDFIDQLITFVKTHSNVDVNNISIYGSSNGSALLNRLLVELPAGSFDNAVCIVSQKIEKMYNNNAFYYDPTGGNAYNTTIVPANDRRIMTVLGTNDGAIPYNGGTGILGYVFMPAQECAFVWAQNKGYNGSQIPDANGVPHPNNANLLEYSYLSGDVVHYKLIGGTHGSSGNDQAVRTAIASFLGL